MSQNASKDSFNDEELTELADEIRNDLQTQSDLHPNSSFAVAFKLKVDINTSNLNNQLKPAKHNALPSNWSYLSVSNTTAYYENEDDGHDIITPHKPQTPHTTDVITPYIPPNLLSMDSFPDIPSVTPQSSIKVPSKSGYDWVRKTYSPSIQLSLTDVSSDSTEDTVFVNYSVQNQRPTLSQVLGLNESMASKLSVPTNEPKHDKYPSKIMKSPLSQNTLSQLTTNNKHCKNKTSMIVHVDLDTDYSTDDGLVFMNSEHM